jgi:inositol polyphosphate 5-phosphatase INPP5B/F
MVIVIYVRTPLLSQIPPASVSTSSVGVGLLGTMGNKGGVGIRLRIHDTELCFVNSHLAASDEMAEKRNADFGEICKRMKFALLPEAGRADAGHAVVGVFDSDYLFWLVRHSISFVGSGTSENDLTLISNLGRYAQSSFSIILTANLTWTQDLNYRIDMRDADLRILLAEIDDSEYGDLLDYDQARSKLSSTKRKMRLTPHCSSAPTSSPKSVSRVSLKAP